jgi:hypothetical protein
MPKRQVELAGHNRVVLLTASGSQGLTTGLRGQLRLGLGSGGRLTFDASPSFLTQRR